MRYFDFTEAIQRYMDEAYSESEKLSAKTTVARLEFLNVARRLGLGVLEGDTCFSTELKDHAIVVGVATWSDSDLDALECLIHSTSASNIKIYVFDIDQCLTESQLRSKIPGCDSSIRQTPVLAEYREGSLVSFLQGSQAITKLRNFS